MRHSEAALCIDINRLQQSNRTFLPASSKQETKHRWSDVDENWRLLSAHRTHTDAKKSSSDIYIYTQVNIDSILLLWTNNQLDLQLYWCDHRHQLLEMSTGRQWSAFSALTLLVGRQQEHPACKNWVMWCWCGAGVVICREWGADYLRMVQLMSLPSQNPIISWLI